MNFIREQPDEAKELARIENLEFSGMTKRYQDKTTLQMSSFIAPKKYIIEFHEVLCGNFIYI